MTLPWRYCLHLLKIGAVMTYIGWVVPCGAQIFTGAQVQYDFESGTPLGWSSQAVSHSFLGGHALGPFGNGTVSLGILDALPSGSDPRIQYAPRTVLLSFDLLLTGLWYGNTPGSESFYQITANGIPLLSTTFSTTDATQSFPQAYGIGTSPAGTGSFAFFPESISATTVTGSFPLYAALPNPTDIGITFSASGLDPSATWQLDNVSVDWAHPIPEPGGMGLAIIGAALLAFRRISHRFYCC